MGQGRSSGPAPGPEPQHSVSSSLHSSISRYLGEAIRLGNEGLKMNIESSPWEDYSQDEGTEGHGHDLNHDYRDATHQGPLLIFEDVSTNRTDLMGPNGLLPDIYMPVYLRITFSILCGIMLLIGILGNILVPVVVWKNKDLRSSTNIFLVNLSMADLLILLVCMPPILIELHTKPDFWILGATLCKVVPFAELSVAHASVLTILAISLERYIAICRPLRANYTCTKTRAIMISGGIWLLACITTSPLLAVVQHRTIRHGDSVEYACLTLVHTLWSRFFFVTSIIVFFFIPFFILIVIYFIISKNLIGDAVEAGRCCPDHPSMRARRQVVIMLATVVVFFFICLLPFRILLLFIIYAPRETLTNMDPELYFNILYACRSMIYLNSTINPILYNVMSSKFREAFFKVLGCPAGSARRNKWMRHLSRSTLTSSTLPSSTTSTKSRHRCCAGAADTVRIGGFNDNPPEPRNGHTRHPRISRAISGPNGPVRQSPPVPSRQLSTEAAIIHAPPGSIDRVTMTRAHSVV